MKRILCAILAIAMTAALLGGCSLFADESNNNDGEKSDGSSRDPVQITDSYTYEDPADLDFDGRYVIYCDETTSGVAFYADAGMKAIYIVIYGKEDKTLRHLTIEVYDTAENAKAAADSYNEWDYGAVIADADPTVLYYLQEGDELEAEIMSYIAFDMMTDDSFESYVDAMHESWGGVLQ